MGTGRNEASATAFKHGELDKPLRGTVMEEEGCAGLVVVGTLPSWQLLPAAPQQCQRGICFPSAPSSMVPSAPGGSCKSLAGLSTHTERSVATEGKRIHGTSTLYWWQSWNCRNQLSHWDRTHYRVEENYS